MLVCGLPGSGKSTLAERLATRIGAEWISSDRLRSELLLQGDYRDAAIDVVYAELIARAKRAATAGRSAVLDATFSSARYREAALAAAAACGAGSAIVRLSTDEATALQRVGTERRESEAAEEAYRLLKRRFDPITQPHLGLDSSERGVETLVAAAMDYLTAL